MRRAGILGAMALIIFGYQDCGGKLGNSGAPVSSSSLTATGPTNAGSPAPSPTPPPPTAGPTELVQSQDVGEFSAGATASIKNLLPTRVGDLFVVLVQDINISLVSQKPGVVGCPCVPTDTSGNTYVNVPGTFFYYAINTVASAAGANTITVNFSTGFTTQEPELFFYEFNGIDTTSPLDSYSAGMGSTTFSMPITTNSPDDIIIGQLDSNGACETWTNGWTMMMTNHVNCWAYTEAPLNGTYTAAGTDTAGGPLQLVAFKKANSAKSQFNLQQMNGSVTSTAATTISAGMRSDQVAGDLNVVVVAFNAGATTTIDGPGTTPHFITDTKGNVYTLVATVPGTGISQSIWYAQNILAAAAGTNTINVQFSTAVTAEMTVSEYSGSTTGASSPLDQANGNANTSTVATTGNVTTVFPNELIITTVAEGIGQDVTGVNSGFRLLPVENFNMTPGFSWYSTADQFVSAVGTYSNTFNLSASKSFVSTIVTFH